MGPGSMGPFNPTDTFEPFVDQGDMNEIVVKSNEDLIGKLSLIIKLMSIILCSTYVLPIHTLQSFYEDRSWHKRLD